MPITVCAFNHLEWERLGLADFAEYADRISECYVGEDAFSGYGKWFCIPNDPLPNGDRVIYFGSWGNDNSPGASSYTHAEIFDVSNPDEAKAFERRVQDWESQPEYDEDESEDWEEGDEQSDEEDIPF
jgi:hypothetical protein